MKTAILSALVEAVAASCDGFDASALKGLTVERCKDAKHGDYATNVALLLVKQLKRNPREIAEQIKAALEASALFEAVAVAGPGFINMVLTPAVRAEVMQTILAQGGQFGEANFGQGKSLYLEFVSANPTGPLHVGHGRGAAYGASLAHLAEKVGFDVTRAYYLNDAGRQMHILALSVWARYLALFDIAVDFPPNAYQGDYVISIAEAVKDQHGDTLCADWPSVQVEDDELAMDAYIAAMKQILGDRYALVFNEALNTVQAGIADDLEAFGVTYQSWPSEQALVDSGAVASVVTRLKDSGYTYEDQGALWFKSSALGDEKDRVLVRSNGEHTYFLNDIAHHDKQMAAGFDQIIDVFGADHHGYVPRMKAAMQALGYDLNRYHVQLVQFAHLYRDGEKIPMSTRSGQFVTLRALYEETGVDAARFFYAQRKIDQCMDFDLSLAVAQSQDNPVYYIQYAYARIASVLRKEESAFDLDKADVSLLTSPHEIVLLNHLAQFPEQVVQSAERYEVHTLAHYAYTLANLFHSYYNAEKFLVETAALQHARLGLVSSVAVVLKENLRLLGLEAPETMHHGA